jgi:hypothetical protein
MFILGLRLAGHVDGEVVSNSAPIKHWAGLFAAPFTQVAMNAAGLQFALNRVERLDACTTCESVGIEMQLDAAILSLGHFDRNALPRPVSISRD